MAVQFKIFMCLAKVEINFVEEKFEDNYPKF